MFASLFGSRPAQPPALDPKELAKIRDKQLSTFFEEHRSVETLDSQRTKFRISVINHLGTLFVMIELGPRFPEEQPSIRLGNSGLSHPWVDPSTLSINHEHLKPGVWLPHHSLSRIVREIAQELCARPPLPISAQPQPQPQQPAQQQSLPAANNVSNPAVRSEIDEEAEAIAAVAAAEAAAAVVAAKKKEEELASHNLPPLGDSIPELDALGISQLQSLMDDQLEFEDFFAELEAVRSIDAAVEQAENECADLATASLERESALRRLAESCAQLGAEERAKRAAVQDLVKRQENVMKKFSIPMLLDSMQRAAELADAQSESLKESFDGQNDADFLRSYVQARKTHHTLSAKADQLRQGLAR